MLRSNTRTILWPTVTTKNEFVRKNVEAKMILADEQSRSLLVTAQQDPAAYVAEVPKITVHNRQTANIVFGNQAEQIVLQLLPTTSDNRRSIDLRQHLVAEKDSGKLPNELTPTNIVSGHTLVVEVTKSITSQMLGEAWSGQVLGLTNLEHLGRLFRDHKANHRIEKTYLLITPRILVPEEE